MSHRRSSRAAGLTALCLALLAAPLPAGAQRLVLSYSPGGFFTPPFTQSWDFAAGRLEWSQPVLTESGSVFTADGSYLVRSAALNGTPRLTVTDAFTGSVTEFPIDFEPRLAHPRRLELYGLTTAGTVARLDLGGVHPYGACVADGARSLDLTVDGSRLLALCQSGDVVAMDAASGAVQRVVSAGAGNIVADLRVNADGTRVLVTRGGASGGVALVDTASGATLGTTVFPDQNPYPGSTPCLAGYIAGASPDRRLVAITCSWTPAPKPAFPTQLIFRTRLLDVDTLTWGIDLGVAYGPSNVAFSPDGRTAFARSLYPRGPFSAFQAIETITGTTLAAFHGMTFSLAVAFAPLPPTLGATVAGAHLDLTWTLSAHSPAATRYVLEAGTAPGLSDIGTLTVGPGQTLSIPGVAPGTYAVRVRAVNATGMGAASNEVFVTVP